MKFLSRTFTLQTDRSEKDEGIKSVSELQKK